MEIKKKDRILCLYINWRIVIVNFKIDIYIDRGYLYVAGVYEPEEGKCEGDEKQANADNMLILGDLNVRIGNITIINTVCANLSK